MSEPIETVRYQRQPEQAPVEEGLPSNPPVENADPAQPAAEGETTETPEGTPKESQESPEETQEEAPEEGKESKSDLDKFRQEFSEKGELSEDSYSELEKLGYDKDMVDTYIEGQKAKAAAYQNQAFEITGGQAKFTAMSEWARSNATADEIKSFNEAVTSGDASKMTEAVRKLNAKFVDAVGQEPTLVSPEATPATGDFYRDRSEYLKDSRDPRYKKSPAFRDQVRNKLARSEIF